MSSSCEHVAMISSLRSVENCEWPQKNCTSQYGPGSEFGYWNPLLKRSMHQLTGRPGMGTHEVHPSPMAKPTRLTPGIGSLSHASIKYGM